VNNFADVQIRLTVHAAVDTSGIDISLGDVTTTVPVDYVNFAVFNECRLCVTTLTVNHGNETISSAALGAAVNERCEALAALLFNVGLTFTVFKEQAA
jgi:hypothetical protein